MAALLDGVLNALPDEVLTVMFGGLFVCGGEKKNYNELIYAFKSTQTSGLLESFWRVNARRFNLTRIEPRFGIASQKQNISSVTLREMFCIMTWHSTLRYFWKTSGGLARRYFFMSDFERRIILQRVKLKCFPKFSDSTLLIIFGIFGLVMPQIVSTQEIADVICRSNSNQTGEVFNGWAS